MYRTARQIGAQLEQILKEQGLTQKAVEGRTGVNQSQISRILRGQFGRITPNVRKLCKYAQLSVDESPPDQNGAARMLKLIDSIVDGSRYREGLLLKLLKVGVELAGGVDVPRAKAKKGRS